MKNLTLASLICLAAVACGKPQTTDPAALVTSYEVAKHKGLSSKNPAEVLAALNEILQDYTSTNPNATPVAAIEDMVTLKILDRLPEAPKGRKFEIQKGAVILK